MLRIGLLLSSQCLYALATGRIKLGFRTQKIYMCVASRKKEKSRRSESEGGQSLNQEQDKQKKWDSQEKLLGNREIYAADRSCRFCTVGSVVLLSTFVHLSRAKFLQSISPIVTLG